MSMTVAELVAGLRERGARLWVEGDRLRCSAPPGLVTEETKAELATRKDEIVLLLRHAQRLETGPRAIVPLRGEGEEPPLFAVPGHNGDVFCYVALVRHLAPGRPLLGIQPPGLDGRTPLRSLDDLVSFELEQIRLCRPRGPYLLIGYCAGGTIAFEIARRLVEEGERVPLVALVASPFPTSYRLRAQLAAAARHLAWNVPRHLRRLAAGQLPPRLRGLPATLAGRNAPPPLPPAHARLVRSREAVMSATIEAIRRYRPRRLPGRLDLFIPSAAWRRGAGRPGLWQAAADAVCEHTGSGSCEADAILMEPHVAGVAAALNARLAELRTGD